MKVLLILEIKTSSINLFDLIQYNFAVKFNTSSLIENILKQLIKIKYIYYENNRLFIYKQNIEMLNTYLHTNKFPIHFIYLPVSSHPQNTTFRIILLNND